MKYENNYKKADKQLWSGRIDSLDNYDAFRWHQWITLLDLNDFHPSLSPSEIGICFVGFCSDEGVQRNLGRPGAAKGPESIRKEMANLPCSFSKKIRLFDCGDILVENHDLEAGQALLGEAVQQILNAGLFPIVLGGGHETALGNYLGLASYAKQESPQRQTNKGSLGIINFDAHFDLRPYENGGSSGTMFRQISDLCTAENTPFSYYCLGIQKHSNTVELFKTADRLGVSYALAKDIIGGDDWTIIESLDSFMKKSENIYVTICTDVFSTAFAPGVSAAQSLGLDPEKVIRYIKYIVKTGKLISFDICEVSPRFDLDSTTADLASVIIYSIITTLDAS